MRYLQLQQRVYENKLRKGFNVTDVGKEIILITEEYGELCDAQIRDDRHDMVDAIGDIMIYCLGLCAMFKRDADMTLNHDIEQPTKRTIAEYLPYVGKELGFFARTYRRSNKLTAQDIDKQEELTASIGRIMGYCSAMFRAIDVDEQTTLEHIILTNEARTKQIRI